MTQISKTREIKNCLKAAFDELLDCVYISYRKIRRNASNQPYLVYDLKQITCNDNLTKYKVEINLWGKSDIDELDDVADVVENALDYAEFTTDSGRFFKLYKSGQREPVDEPEKDLERLRIIFELNLYERID